MKKFIAICVLWAVMVMHAVAQNTVDASPFVKGNPNIYSILVARNNQIVQKSFYNGRSDTSLFNVQSLTKGVCSLLIGIAINEHFIRSADQKITDFFPELNNDPDARKQQVTIRQIMNQASGLYHEDLSKIYLLLGNASPSNLVLRSPMAGDPGKEWHYNNAASHLISVILTRATHMDTKAFATKYLFNPMGITHFEWAEMRDGYYDGSGLLSIRMQSSDLMKIGLMMMQNGMYNHKQVVPRSWISLLLNPDVKYKATWGFNNSEYALDWYHINYEGGAVTYGMGWGGQFIMLMPALNAMIVINQNTADKDAISQSNNFIENIFPLIYRQLAANLRSR